MDPERKVVARRALLWTALSYVPLIAGVAWAAFAASHWAGSRGVFLAVSGAMAGIAGSAALFLPVTRQVAPTRRLLGMSLARYTYLSIGVAIAIAVALAIAAFAVPEN